MSESILSCEGVSKQFEQLVYPTELLQDRVIRWRRHHERWVHQALSNVSLSLQKGEWLGITGPNGSGKTTLLRILSNLIMPDTGTVVQNGNISCFFELGAGFHPDRCAQQNVRIHSILHGMSSREIQESMPKILDFADIRSHLNVPIKCYSNGMKMRLAFAAAAFVESDVYLFDEIIAVGDKQFQQKCFQHMSNMKNRGKSAILVAADDDPLRLFCDRLVYMENGAIQVDEQLINAIPVH